MSLHTSLRSFFSSIRLTIVLLILIAFLSVSGTLIPQQEGSHELIGRLNPLTAALLIHFQVFDIFHSYVFRALMVLLSLNILVCSLNRIPVSLRLINAPAFPVPHDFFENVEPDRIVMSDMPKDEMIRRLEAFLKKRFGKILTEGKDGTAFIFAERHRFAHLGVYVVHLSILVIILGTLVGSFSGFEGYLRIDEGQSVQALELRGGRGIRPLDFSVRCDRFLVDFYENGAPKTYRSDLSFIKDGRVVHQGAVLVNHPVTFESIRFYQSSYEPSPNNRAFLSYARSGLRKDITVTARDVIDLAEDKATLTVLRIEQNIMGMGPAVKLGVESSRGDVQFWVFKLLEEIKAANPMLLERVPLFDPARFKPYIFTLNGVEQKYQTVLQGVNDPALPIIIIGAFLMVNGLLIVFYLSHWRLWVCIDTADGKTRIRIADRSGGKRWVAGRDIRLLLSNLHQEIKST